MSTSNGVGFFSRGLQFLKHPLHSLSKSNRAEQAAQKLTVQLTVQGYLTEFLTSMKKVLPTTTDANRSIIRSLSGRPAEAYSGVKDRISNFIRSELPKYLQRPDGKEFAFSILNLVQGSSINDEYLTPEINTLVHQMNESLVEADSYGWFTHPTGELAFMVSTTISLWAPRG